MIRTIGIDLGTTNTVAAYIKRGEPREIRNLKNEYLTPSALALTPQGELLIGIDARSRGTSKVMSFKPDMGTDKAYQFNKLSYTPMELSTLILRHVKKYVEKELGEPILRAVITVPAWFSERAIVETREAGFVAGFYVVKTFSEPMAAALAWGMDREETDPKTVLVYDLGGGTFDIAVLMVTPGNFAALDHEGDVHLGGDNFDSMMSDYIRMRLKEERGITFPDDDESLYRLRLACEKAKIELSINEIVEVHLTALGKVGTDINIEITRPEFETMIRPWLIGPRKERDEHGNLKKSTLEHTRLAISNSDLTTDTIDNILLVGGSTCIPLVPNFLGNEFGKEKIQSTVHPMFCVAHGAAIESTLISEIDCIKCHAKNPLDVTRCQKCGAPLIGEEKIDCPRCFMPSPVGEKKCWKCGSNLHGKEPSEGGHEINKKCPEGHNNPLQATKCAKCGYVFDEGGIKCIRCNKIIKPTDHECPHCGAKRSEHTDVTSKDIGIELNDGSFSVIIKKGTNYPTEKSFHALYGLPVANATHMKIIVREGQSDKASENEWLGDLTLELPKGQPENTPIDISIDLDTDSTIFVSAKLVDHPLSVVNASMERVPGGAQLLKDAEDLQKRINELKTKVGKEDQKLLNDLCSEIEEAIHEKDTRVIGMRKTDWEKRLESPEAEAKEKEQITNSIGWGESTLRVASKYINNESKNKIENLIKEARKAYDNGDMKLALEKSKQLSTTLDELGNNIQLITYAEAAAHHRAVSAATSNQIFKVLAELESAVRAGNGLEIEQKLKALAQLFDQACQELERAGIKIDLVLPRELNTGLGRMT